MELKHTGVVMRIVKIKKRVACFLWVFAIAFLFTVGCTANKIKPEAESLAIEDTAVEAKSSVELISVVRMGDAVLIEADGLLSFTSFRLDSPSMVIIDLPAVNVDKVQSPIDIDNDYITTITSSSYGEGEGLIGRIEIGLQEGVAYEVKAGEDSLLVVFSGAVAGSVDGGSAALEDTGLGPWDIDSENGEEIVDGFAMIDDETEQDLDQDADEPEMQSASTVVDLKLESDDEKTVVRIITDGEVGNYNAFGLDDPTRVVVDIWGIDSSLYDDAVKVDSAILKQVRLGIHDDKVRFVFDSSSAAVPYYSIRKDGPSLVVTLSSDPISEPVDESQAGAAEFEEDGLEVADAAEDIDPWNLPIEEVEQASEEAVDEAVTEEIEGEVEALAEGPEVAALDEDEKALAEEAEEGGSQQLLATEEALSEEVEEVIEAAPRAPVIEVLEAVVDPAPELMPELALANDNEGGETTTTSEEQEDAELAEMEAMEDAEPDASGETLTETPGESAFVDPTPSLPLLQEEIRTIVRKDPVDVQAVDFRLMGDVARLTITNSDVARFRVKESTDGKVLNIDILNAFIPDNLKSTLDAAALGTPVSTISSYQAYTEPVGNVRIIVKLSERVPYDISRSGNAINMDFPLMTWVEQDKAEAVKKGEDLSDELALSEEEDVVKKKEEGGKYTGRKINIDMVDAEVTDMLKLLAEVSDLNIIASGEVNGKITLRLKDVPWDQAFDLILRTRGLGSIQDGNVVRVAPAARIREEREGALAAKKAATKLEDIKTEYIRINYDKAKSLSAQLDNLLSDRGSITVHEPTNTVIVRDISIAIEDVKSYIKKVDIPIPQVLIEARIVEATSSFARDLGVQWGLDIKSVGNQITTSSFGSMDENYGQWAADPSQQTGTLVSGGTYNVEKKNFLANAGVTNYAVNLPATGTAGTLGALGFILGKTGANPLILDLRISAGEQKGLVKTISRPRIITMNNKEAKIEQGESIPFETSTVDGSSTTFIDANLSLTVKPQITPDGSVLMEIKASRNSIGSFRNSSGEPSINTKEASTHVLVRNGETTVMGGIIVSDSNNSERGIPFFKDVPFLGWLFKSQSISDSQTELLIFITPTILNQEDIEG
ncbi:Type IV pilus biogenesis protein PilQ [hydrothermal vent metagenome]|uniref:Type IV pilus biogenesis protein PilQ n=1 Tax=hydrothermal vent metagenome TaxID=652676 RepID=A0A3B0QQW2_9ZZZZ